MIGAAFATNFERRARIIHTPGNEALSYSRTCVGGRLDPSLTKQGDPPSRARDTGVNVNAGLGRADSAVTQEVPLRLPKTAHTSRPWRIHEFTSDFRLEDVWNLPATGGSEDFQRLVRAFASADPMRGASRPIRWLWRIRWGLGELLGWDEPGAGLGSRVPTLRHRLPMDLLDGPRGPGFSALPFSSLYLLDDEWAAEIANRTMHGVMHIGRVPETTGGFRIQMAVLVKPNGLLGASYMAAIRPFRRLIVYPAMMRRIEREAQAARCGPDPEQGQ